MEEIAFTVVTKPYEDWDSTLMHLPQEIMTKTSLVTLMSSRRYNLNTYFAA